MRAFVTAALLILALSACSGADDQTATDPAPTSPTSGAATVPQPLEQGTPAASGPVRTRDLVTVIQLPDKGAEVCLGPMTMIYPPQCGGPAVEGWDWKTSGQGMFEEEAGTRFGSYALTGTWDGTALTVTAAIPAALYDVAAVAPSAPPIPTRDFTEAELTDIATEAGTLPGASGAASDGTGHVLVDVVYDDGSIQSYADEVWGAGVVIVTGALLDAD